HLVAIGQFLADGLGRGQREDLVGRELALGQNIENFAAHIARGPDDSDAITHFGTPVPYHFRPRAIGLPSRSVLSSLSPAGVRPGEKRQAVLVVLVMASTPPAGRRVVAKAAMERLGLRMTNYASY